MQSTIQLYNVALARLGGEQIPQGISPIESDATGALCQNLFPHILDLTLTAYPWRFATKSAELAQVQQEGHLFHFALPADCLRTIDAYNGEGGVLPFHIEGTGIAAPSERVLLKYVGRVADPRLFPAPFADALAWRLAAELAISRGNDTRKQQLCMQQYEVSLALAIARETAMQRPEQKPSAWLMARKGR